jgi:hypothetical protein
LRILHIPDIEIYYIDLDVVAYRVEYKPLEEVKLQPLYSTNLKIKCVYFLLNKVALQR